MVYNGTSYGYLYNVQGDVIGLVNGSGTKVVTYKYDAWGKLLSCTGSLYTTLGTVNPFRYRGYIYDRETGLYYLRSRYYNPNWCRFISADALIEGNLFAYCENDTVNKSDWYGYSPQKFHYVIDQERPQYVHNSELAYAIGERADVSKGYIGINLNTENDNITDLLSYGMPLNNICDRIAFAACEKYQNVLQEEFILRWECVSYEIQEHIIAYQFSIGERWMPNALALGYMISHSKGKEDVRRATENTDIRERDVVPGDFKSQSSLFDYKNGINLVYIGSARDPWREERK